MNAYNSSDEEDMLRLRIGIKTSLLLELYIGNLNLLIWLVIGFMWNLRDNDIPLVDA